MKRNNQVLNKVIQLIVIFLLALGMGGIFSLVQTLQGTAKVINYTGIVRGATQRLIKLEIAGQPNEDLSLELDLILEGLKHGGGQYNLKCLKDKDYQRKLELLMQMWMELKEEIKAYRRDNLLEPILVEKSEFYFVQANEVVSTVEIYADGNLRTLRLLEILFSFGVIYLIVNAFGQTLRELKLKKQNDELSYAAYIDRMTGIPSRRRCEEIIYSPVDLQKSRHTIVMFDLNNLKTVNDMHGHRAGDRVIKAFADILIRFANDMVFVGRYGGDEFLMIIHDYDENQIRLLFEEIHSLVEEHNNRLVRYPINYAYGYDNGGDALHKMLDRADQKMYQMKKDMKEQAERKKESEKG